MQGQEEAVGDMTGVRDAGASRRDVGAGSRAPADDEQSDSGRQEGCGGAGAGWEMAGSRAMDASGDQEKEGVGNDMGDKAESAGSHEESAGSARYERAAAPSAGQKDGEAEAGSAQADVHAVSESRNLPAPSLLSRFPASEDEAREEEACEGQQAEVVLPVHAIRRHARAGLVLISHVHTSVFTPEPGRVAIGLGPVMQVRGAHVPSYAVAEGDSGEREGEDGYLSVAIVDEVREGGSQSQDTLARAVEQLATRIMHEHLQQNDERAAASGMRVVRVLADCLREVGHVTCSPTTKAATFVCRPASSSRTPQGNTPRVARASLTQATPASMQQGASTWESAHAEAKTSAARLEKHRQRRDRGSEPARPAARRLESTPKGAARKAPMADAHATAAQAHPIWKHATPILSKVGEFTQNLGQLFQGRDRNEARAGASAPAMPRYGDRAEAGGDELSGGEEGSEDWSWGRDASELAGARPPSVLRRGALTPVNPSFQNPTPGRVTFASPSLTPLKSERTGRDGAVTEGRGVHMPRYDAERSGDVAAMIQTPKDYREVAGLSPRWSVAAQFSGERRASRQVSPPPPPTPPGWGGKMEGRGQEVRAAGRHVGLATGATQRREESDERQVVEWLGEIGLGRCHFCFLLAPCMPVDQSVRMDSRLWSASAAGMAL